MLPRSAAFHQEIECTFAGLKGHEHALAVKIPCRGKAIAAAQVAVVRHVQAHGLDRASAENLRRGGRFGFECAARFELLEIGKHLGNRLRVYADGIRVFSVFDCGYDGKCRLINGVNRAAFNIEQHVVVLELERMDQMRSPCG